MKAVEGLRFGGRLHRKNSIWLHEGKAPRRHQASFLSGGFQKAKAAQGQIAADRSLLAHACGFGEAADAYFGTLRNKNRTDKSFSHSRPSHRQTTTSVILETKSISWSVVACYERWLPILVHRPRRPLQAGAKIGVFLKTSGTSV